MSIRMEITLLIYMMVQGLLFGAAVVALLVSPLADSAMHLMPWLVGATALVSVPLSWMVAQRLRAATELRSAV